MAVDYHAHTVLLTGASSGIGAALAGALAARGANLVLVARRAERLTALAGELRRTGRVRVETVPFDLSRPDAGSELRAAVADRGMRITSLINNAAIGSFAPFAAADRAQLAAEIALGVTAPVELTAAFLPDMLSAGNGFIINVAGVTAYLPAPRMAVYGATKAFAISFTDSLWTELRGTGVTVFAVSPGATDTGFTAGMGPEARVLTSGRLRSPEDVAATALTHLERRSPGPAVVDGRMNRFAVVLSRFMSRRQSAMMMWRAFDPTP
jgi:short-subunit dehydrogenase